MKSLYHTTVNPLTHVNSAEWGNLMTYEYMTVLHSHGSAEPFGGAT